MCPARNETTHGPLGRCLLAIVAPAMMVYRWLRLTVHARLPRAPRSLSFALLLALILPGALLFGWFVPLVVHITEYETLKTGISGVRLEDGTTVDLAPETTLRVQMLRHFRFITVPEGEALIHVAKDTTRPLEILAGKRVIRAVGTKFSVRQRPGAPTAVLVTEGTVLVLPASARTTRNPSDGVPVQAGELAQWNGREPTRVRAISASEQADRLAWRVQRVSFAGTPLRQAVQEINRFNLMQIVIDDPAIAGVVIDGRFEASPPDSFVEALQALGVVQKRSATENTDPREIHLIRATARPPGPAVPRD